MAIPPYTARLRFFPLLGESWLTKIPWGKSHHDKKKGTKPKSRRPALFMEQRRLHEADRPADDCPCTEVRRTEDSIDGECRSGAENDLFLIRETVGGFLAALLDVQIPPKCLLISLFMFGEAISPGLPPFHRSFRRKMAFCRGGAKMDGFQAEGNLRSSQ